MESGRRVLVVDLNNYARYPTLGVGYLVASLRSAGIEVDVLSPLQHGVVSPSREGIESRFEDVQRRIQFSGNPVLARLHDFLRRARGRGLQRRHPKVVELAEPAIVENRPDAVLISSYLDYRTSVEALATMAKRHGIPTLLGGPYFNVPEVLAEWLELPGVDAVVGAEVEFTLPRIVENLVSGRAVEATNGVGVGIGRAGPPAPPLEDLERLPVPDFRDFPWERYPHPIIPVMAGRGCGWGRCTFCSDVTSVAGRGFRTRPVEKVLDELRVQSERHGSSDYIFLDLKLNSDLAVWRGIIDGIQDAVPGARWIATVHVDARGDHGLTAEDLAAAVAAGLTRISFGLETGSQRLNQRMSKGTSTERNSAFIRDASRAGLSVRTSMMLGYPGETANDIDETVDLLRMHDGELDRIRLSRFKAIAGTRFHRQYESEPSRFDALADFEWDHRYARASFRYTEAARRDYRRSKRKLLSIVHEVNSRPLRDDASEFDGLM